MTDMFSLGLKSCDKKPNFIKHLLKSFQESVSVTCGCDVHPIIVFTEEKRWTVVHLIMGLPALLWQWAVEETNRQAAKAGTAQQKAIIHDDKTTCS